MKKKDIVDLIVAHYENDFSLFFQKTIEILKEFKDDGDAALVDHLDFILKSHVKIAPKREQAIYPSEISFDEASDLCWVPQGAEADGK